MRVRDMKSWVMSLAVGAALAIGGGAVGTREALGQACGSWASTSASPDLPSGLSVRKLATLGTDVYALTDDPTRPLWRLSAGVWTALAWDAGTMGTLQTFSTDGGVVGAATSRIISQQQVLIGGNFFLQTVFELAVRSWNGAGWQLEASGSRTSTHSIGSSSSLTFTDLTQFQGAWYASARSSASSPPLGSSSSGALYRSNAGTLEVVGTTDSSSCTLVCLNPNTIADILGTGSGLYIAGRFNSITPTGGSAVSVANLARYTGSAFVGVGAAPNSTVRGVVYVASSFQPTATLVAWGDFTQVGALSASRIALYDTASNVWTAMGSGVDVPPSAVVPIAGLQGALDVDYAAVGVSMAGGVSVNAAARWTGSAWQSLAPVGTPSLTGTLLTAVNQGGVIVGGQGLMTQGRELFGVAKLTGSMWGHLSSQGTNGVVRAMGVHGGEVYAGGEFTRMDGVSAARIARRTATGWEALGSGVNGPVLGMTSFAGELIVVGNFNAAGGVPAGNVAAWNGSTWRALGTGVDDTACGATVWNNALIVVGAFRNAGAVETGNVARWTGSAWEAVDASFQTTELFAACVYNNQLHVGGDNGIWRLSAPGAEFQIVGGGIGLPVRALLPLAGSLYVGGEFATVGSAPGVTAPRLARWNGTQWFAVGTGGGSGISDFNSVSVQTLFGDVNGLFVGGDVSVSTSGGFVSNAARFDGAAWHPLPDGSPNGVVYCGALLGDRAWYGGAFSRVGTVASMCTAAWRGGPVVVSEPLDVDVCDTSGNGTAMFSVQAVGASTYRWHKNGTPLTDNLRISGVLTPMLMIGGVIESDEGLYTCVVTDTCMTNATSRNAVLVVGCCPADFNGSGALTVQDVFDYLTAFFANAPAADYNGIGGITIQDVFDFLNDWFMGC